ncbi:hypothetical protein KEM52_002393 [Ascosphaera acerosa]|nr:hypothetical protein KEM52_002393 [Ascosphaera acerosa]
MLVAAAVAEVTHAPKPRPQQPGSSLSDVAVHGTASETETSERSYRRIGRATGGGNRKEAHHAESSPDLRKRGRKEAERERERQRDRASEARKMKTVTLLTRPQQQQQPSSVSAVASRSGSASDAQQLAAPPPNAATRPSQSRRQGSQRSQHASPSTQPTATFQPQRILKRPEPVEPSQPAASPTDPKPVPGSRSQEQKQSQPVPEPQEKSVPKPGDVITVGAFAKPAKHGMPAVAAEPVRRKDAPRVIQRKKLPIFEVGGGQSVKPPAPTILLRRDTAASQGRADQGLAAQGVNGGKDELLSLFEPADGAVQGRAEAVSNGNGDGDAISQASQHPELTATNATQTPTSAPAADNKAFLLDYLNSVASQSHEAA